MPFLGERRKGLGEKTEVKKDMMNYEMFKGAIETELANFCF